MSGGLPNRPRAHQIEDLSIVGFRSSMPPAWVFHDRNADYGVDGEVEVFSQDGATTGLGFFVQLKATDKVGPAARRVSLRMETLNYFQTLAVPVIVLRWVDSEKKLYWKWAHSIDPYEARKKKQKSIGFLFLEEDLWTAKTPEGISQRIQQIREIRNGQLTRPYAVEFSIGADWPDKRATIRALDGFRQRLSNKEFIVAVSGEASNRPRLELRFHRDHVVASVAGLPGPVLDLSERDWASGVAITDGLLAGQMFWAYTHCGQWQAALRIAELFGEDIAKNGLPHFSGRVFELFMEHRKVAEAFAFLKNVELSHPEDILRVHRSLLSSSGEFSHDEVECVVRHFDTEIEKGDSRRSATAAYNAANFLENKNEYARSVEYFDKAALLNPDYLRKPYFHQERGAAQFELGYFSLAAQSYGEAKRLGFKGPLSNLIGDCLMRQGRFAEACIQFRDYFSNCDDPDVYWALPFYVCSYVVNALNISAQQRSNQHIEIGVDFSQAKSLEEAFDLAMTAFAIDALHPLTWFNLGIFANKVGEDDFAEFAFLVPAVVNHWDEESWLNAMICGFNNNSPAVRKAAIFEAGYFHNGEGIVTKLRETFLGPMKSDGPIGSISDLIDSMFSTIRASVQRKKTMVVRVLHNENDQYSELKLRLD